MKYRITRLSDTTHKIAAGLALGISISFSPFLGTHFLQVALIAYLFRFNILAGLTATFIGNPWTFPFMWWASISLGAYIFGLLGLPASTSLPEYIDFEILWDIIKNEPLRIFLPWMVGGYLIALLSWPLSYFLFYNMVQASKIAQSKVRLRRLKKRAKNTTKQKQ